jgi:hypothetical protein
LYIGAGETQGTEITTETEITAETKDATETKVTRGYSLETTK